MINPVRSFPWLIGFLTGAASLAAATLPPPALTIYNQDFAVVREYLDLDLAAGVNPVEFAGVTASLEADSVLLRDPTGRVALRVLEQGYRAETVSAGLMLARHEGREVDFIARDRDGVERIVRGRVVRSGWQPGGVRETPIVEVDGQLRFSLPGEPVFPALDDDAILSPTLSWQLHSATATRVRAELSYLTGGLSWAASYNLVLPEKGDRMDMVGWVTVRNASGKRFDEAAVKLMAGEVSKLSPPTPAARTGMRELARLALDAPAEVTQKSFDEFHLYTLPRPLTLRDQETRQVEFIRATGVPVRTLYVYDGAAMEQYRGWNLAMARENPDYGVQGNRRVGVYREFDNTREAGLGLPLPAGRTRFYRADDDDGRLEFTGENEMRHTPQGETVRLYTGDAFDLVGERVRTAYTHDKRSDTIEEAFTLTLRNRKAEPVEIRVVERLYRGPNAAVAAASHEYERKDDRTVEFRVTVAPDAEEKLTYRASYPRR